MYTGPGSSSALDYVSQFKTESRSDANLLNLLGGKYRIPSDKEWEKLKALLADDYRKKKPNFLVQMKSRPAFPLFMDIGPVHRLADALCQCSHARVQAS